MSVFEHIERSIERSQLYHPRPFYTWNLPRQIGATTWLKERIKQELYGTRVVAYVVHGNLRDAINYITSDPQLYEAYHKTKQLRIVNESNFYNLRGMTINAAFCDNTIYWKRQKREEFLAAFIPTMAGGGRYILEINTTEGENYG